MLNENELPLEIRDEVVVHDRYIRNRTMIEPHSKEINPSPIEKFRAILQHVRIYKL
jgi:hypothetical protein